MHDPRDPRPALDPDDLAPARRPLDKDADDLFCGTSLGTQGARDLAAMTPEAVAEAVLPMTSYSDTPLPPAVNSLIRSACIDALRAGRTARENPPIPCWQCGAPRVPKLDVPATAGPAGRRHALGGVVVTGSIAYDRLMRYPGLLSTQLTAVPGLFADERYQPGRTGRHILSINAETLTVRRGGIAANICYGLTQLGIRPTIVSAVGGDGDDLLMWLTTNGVDVRSVLIDEHQHTARFDCVMDVDYHQVATFAEGAGVREAEIGLSSVLHRSGGARLVLITSASTDAMLRHTREAREARIPFVADPSKRLRQDQLNRSQLRELLDGAAYLVCNSFERQLIEETTGWGFVEILRRVDCLVTTRGPQGVEIESGDERLSVPPAAARIHVDPMGIGDAFRSGFFGGRMLGLSLPDAARLGCVFSSMALDVVGTQEYQADPDDILKRIQESYNEKTEVAVTSALAHLTGSTEPIRLS
ncbi:MAG: PfkB family carbohydrate kinase [Actinobacteria bacterium]|nr:PfkB family carbohydrate kinase [Actinomycetota bacterium]